MAMRIIKGRKRTRLLVGVVLFMLAACSGGSSDGVGDEASRPSVMEQPTPTVAQGVEAATTAIPTSRNVADVRSVVSSGEPGAYRFAVEIASPDSGCDQYADWWEVLSEEGTLLYRRILAHSHVDEQPFVRSGAPIPIEAATVVWVRAHMNNGGYGGVALRGSVASGFVAAPLDSEFAAEVAQEAPLPRGCDF